MQSDTKQFPVVRGSNLNGEAFTLPGDLAGDRNVVIVAWEREHQQIVDTWLPTLARFAATYPAFRYYEVPVIEKLPAIARWFIDTGMRSGIPDTGVRALTVTLYTDKAAFREALGLDGESTIYVLLVTRQGTVLWRGAGAYTEAQGNTLEDAINEAGKA